MTVKDEAKESSPADSSNQEQSSLDCLKKAAKGLEKAITGVPIERDALVEVVKAIKGCKEIPENLIRGLCLVLASNVLNNSAKPSNEPYSILEALLDVDYQKTSEFFVTAISKQLDSTSQRFVYDTRMGYLRLWLLKVLVKKPGKLPLNLVVDALLIIAELSLHLPSKSLPHKLFNLHKQLDLQKLIDELAKRVNDDQPNAWKVLCSVALLLQALTSERKRRVEKGEQNGSSPSDPNLHSLAKLWLKAFSATYFLVKSYPGDDVLHFASGYKALNYLEPTDMDDHFRSSLKKSLLQSPETSLPALANLFSLEHEFPVEIVNLLVDLLPNVYSSTSDQSHEFGAQIFGQILYLTDSDKRKKMMDSVFGKSSKVKSRNEYGLNLEKFLLKLFPGYAKKSVEYLNQFVDDLLTSLESELQTIKSDSATANSARVFSALSRHITASQTPEALSKRYVTVASTIFKLAANNFPLSVTFGSAALALSDLKADAYPDPIFDSIKQHVPLFANPTIPSDFVFYTTLLLFKMTREGGKARLTKALPLFGQILASDVFVKEKFLAGLSKEALQYGSTFVRDFALSLNHLDQPTFNKIPKNTAILRFLFLLLEWPLKMKIHPSFKVAEYLSHLKPKYLSWTLDNHADFLNGGEFGEAYLKLIDSLDPHNLFDSSRLLTKSHYINKLPLILHEFLAKNQKIDEGTLAELLYNALRLANNSQYKDDAMLKQLADFLIKNEDSNRVVFDQFFESKKDAKQGPIIDQIYLLEPLRCRRNIIEFLIKMESANSRHRDHAWAKCLEFCEQIKIDKLNDVSEKEAGIFFTEAGTLYNTAVIDENSDFNLDKRNLKRESKAYSHKDQLAEIELRKQIAEKNKREGKLTPRQQEAIKKELAKEAETRKEVAPLYDAPKKLAELLPVALRSDPNGALQHYQIFHSYIVPLLKSNLVGKLMLECVIEYRDTFFAESSDFLGDRVVAALLRATKSDLTHQEWTNEKFPEQVSKIFSTLQTLCMMNNMLTEQTALDALELLKDEEENESAFNEGLTLGKLALIVPILERVYTDVKVEERLRREATNFLKAAFALDFLTVEEREWIPIKLINELLLTVMCDANNVDYFDDIFELMKGILLKLNAENAESENVGNYVKRLIEQLKNTNEIIREHVAQLLLICTSIISNACLKTNDIYYLTLILIATKDVYRQSDNELHELTDELKITLKDEMHDTVINELKYPHQFWQKATAVILCSLFNKKTITQLDSLYQELQILLPAIKDRVGRIITPERSQWESRRGIGIALEFYIESDMYDDGLFEDLMKFLVPGGISDHQEVVRQTMSKAATSLISKSGAQKVDFVLPHLESLLENLPNTAEYDGLRNGLVCLLGTLARYLDPDSPKLRTIFARLIEDLSVPSKEVQQSVASCIPPLAKLLKDHSKDELRRLFRSISQEKSFAKRIGYAYGVAGLTKGLGLMSMKEIDFMSKIMEMFESKDANLREAACLLFMSMSYANRSAFNPYTKKLLQPLINSFGDKEEIVRNAARAAAAEMMKTMSPTSVKIFLPIILSGLEVEAWRTKCASADFLASISNLAPDQLSECLPKVIPGLSSLLTDSHSKVKESGINALRQIAHVITNPEILSISSHLISALIEPAKETTRTLQIIVNTKFIHFIDPPALALMMPILKRALNDREPEGRRMASNVVTNIFSIADEKDVEPYMPMLLPNLKHSLLDPAPEVRSSAAQAIGQIVRHNTGGVFTSYTSDLIPWLKEHMMSKSSMVDRMGAAQGLAEVVSAFEAGTEAVMDQAVAYTSDSNNDPASRDGYIRLFTYLPSTMGDRFIPFIERVVPAILLTLSDETEYLRNSALHCGQILISTFCSQAKRYLLPSLLEGTVNESWRIRHAAVTLIGDFLFNISGISSKMSSDTAHEDDTFGMANVDKTIIKYVGQKTRDRILVSLYLARFDAGVQVRQASSHVWKLVVANTPRTVKELLSDLFDLMVYCISTSTEDRRHMATECLSEVVRKTGERCLNILMPEVEKSLDQEKDVEHRRGAIEALAIIINSVPSSEVFENFNENIVRIFKMCLRDPDLRLRQSAAETFAVYANIVR